jgi:hypothetical protein
VTFKFPKPKGARDLFNKEFDGDRKSIKTRFPGAVVRLVRTTNTNVQMTVTLPTVAKKPEASVEATIAQNAMIQAQEMARKQKGEFWDEEQKRLEGQIKSAEPNVYALLTEIKHDFDVLCSAIKDGTSFQRYLIMNRLPALDWNVKSEAIDINECGEKKWRFFSVRYQPRKDGEHLEVFFNPTEADKKLIRKQRVLAPYYLKCEETMSFMQEFWESIISCLVSLRRQLRNVGEQDFFVEAMKNGQNAKLAINQKRADILKGTSTDIESMMAEITLALENLKPEIAQNLAAQELRNIYTALLDPLATKLTLIKIMKEEIDEALKDETAKFLYAAVYTLPGDLAAKREKFQQIVGKDIGLVKYGNEILSECEDFMVFTEKFLGEGDFPLEFTEDDENNSYIQQTLDRLYKISEQIQFTLLSLEALKKAHNQ